jgi:hypothetical protein
MIRYSFKLTVKKTAKELPTNSIKGKTWNPLGIYYQPRGKSRMWVIVVGMGEGDATRLKLAEEDVIIEITPNTIDHIS